jgi:transcriptional regulator with XRE-family HTH domain
MYVLLFISAFQAFCIVQKIKDNTYLKKLGNRIRTLRKEKGLSQLDLGVSMDNYAEQISRIERGQLNVSICTLKKIADGLETPLYELLKF